MLRWLSALVLSAFCSCGGPSGVTNDAGDVNASTADAGRSDSGTTAVGDAGNLVDAGARPDAGIQNAIDAGPTVPLDAGPTTIVDAGSTADAGLHGAFSFLTYNVAGLPQGISHSNPLVNTPLISPKLNAFDVVVVQEDFTYHAELIASATHAFKSVPFMTTIDVGDGLNALSRLSFSGQQREKWNECNGFLDQSSDCLTSKGYLLVKLELAPGVIVHLYDIHADAGRSTDDAKARMKQVNQLVSDIVANSSGVAVIVAGDTNMKTTDEPQLQAMISGAGLSDVCRTLSCAEPERIDRILFRNGGGVTLTPSQWKVETTFVDSTGTQLSDHEPVSARFEWSKP